MFTRGFGAPGIGTGPPRCAQVRHGYLCLGPGRCQPPDTPGAQAVPGDVVYATGGPPPTPWIVGAVSRCLPTSGTLLAIVSWSCTPHSTGTADLIGQFEALHEPVVRAQGLGLEDAALHAHLAGSLDGEALTVAFLAASATARTRQLEGARVEVESVVYETIDVLHRTARDAELDASWLVTGSVHHGDHSHRRATRYAARYRMQDTAQGPRITAERARDAVRLPAAPPPGARAPQTALELRGRRP